MPQKHVEPLKNKKRQNKQIKIKDTKITKSDDKNASRITKTRDLTSVTNKEFSVRL